MPIINFMHCSDGCWRWRWWRRWQWQHRATAISDIVLCHRHRRFHSCYKCFSIVFLHWWIIITWNIFHFYRFFSLFFFGFFPYIFSLSFGDKSHRRHHTTDGIKWNKTKIACAFDGARFSITWTTEQIAVGLYVCVCVDASGAWENKAEIKQSHILCHTHIRMVVVGCRFNLQHSELSFFYSLGCIFLLFFFIFLFLFRLLLFMFGIIAAKHIFRAALYLSSNESECACYRYTVVAMAKIWQR